MRGSRPEKDAGFDAEMRLLFVKAHGGDQAAYRRFLQKVGARLVPYYRSRVRDRSDVEDLFRVATFGFRGEALPSIAAVSNLTIISREKEAPIGARLEVRSGVASAVQPAGAPARTIVEVRELFANVPARRRFLKQPRTELSHCVETMRRLLLPHPEVAEYFQRKATDYDRWLRGMRRLQNQINSVKR